MTDRQRGSGRIFLRNKTYWIAFFVAGVEHRESAKTEDPKVAEKYLRAALKRAHAHEVNPTATPFFTVHDRKRTVADLMGALKTNYQLRGKLSLQNASNIKRVTADFGHVPALSLSDGTIANYTRDRVAEVRKDGQRKFKNASINRWLETLRAGYALAKLPVPGIVKLDEKDNVRQGFFTETQIRHVLANLPPDLADFTLFAWLSGWRKSAISRLKWSDVDGETIVLRAENAKNRTAQRIPLEGELATLIKRRQQRRAVKVGETVVLSDWIFHRRGARVQEFRKAWRTATKVAGAPGRLFHDLRRSVARHMTAAGVPQHVIMQTAGWKSPNVFRRYAIVAEQDMRQALQRVEEYRRTTVSEHAEKNDAVALTVN